MQTIVGLSQTDLAGRFNLVNDKYCEIVGRSREELKHLRMHDITHPADLSRNLVQFDECVRTGKAFEIEKRYIRPDGSVVWAHNSVSLVRDRAGNPESLVAAVKDVTDRRRSEMLQREQEHLLEMIATGCPLQECLDALTDAASRLSPDARAAVLIADQSRSRMETVIAAQFPASFGDRVCNSPIGDLTEGICAATIRHGKPVACSDIGSVEGWSAQWRDLWLAHGVMAAYSTPVFRTDGKAIASFMLCFRQPREPDLWERRIAVFGAHIASIAIARDRAEKSLRESKERLAEELADAQLLQAISGALIEEENGEFIYQKIIDAAAAIMHSEYASIQLLYPERGTGGELRLLAHRGFDPQAAKFWEWVRADSESTCGAALRTSERVIVDNVETCDFMAGTEDLATYLETGIHAVQSTPLVSRGGKLMGMISTHWRKPHQPRERELRLLDVVARQAADLMERRMAEEALRRVNKELEQFAYTASHDLQEPVRNIAIYGELLERQYSANLGQKGRQYLEFMTGGARRMEMLIKDLLAYTRSTSADDVTSGMANASDALNRALANLAEAIRETQAKIEVCDRGLPALRMSEMQLEQLFQNLIGNAIKYRSENEPPRVQITAILQGSFWHFSVQDNGIGIEPEYKEKVFGLFKRLHNQTRYSGTGIGLAICQRIVERNGGRIWVESEGAGKGSNFLFTLPA